MDTATRDTLTFVGGMLAICVGLTITVAAVVTVITFIDRNDVETRFDGCIQRHSETACVELYGRKHRGGE